MGEIVFAVRGGCPDTGFPDGSAVLLSTDGVAVMPTFARSDDVPDDSESVAISCLEEQMAGKGHRCHSFQALLR